LFSLSDLDFLSSDPGARLLERLAADDLSDANTLRLLTALRREVAPSQAGAALELARLRKAGVEKFGADAPRMFFTREALEQASHLLVRRYRAKRDPGEPIRRVLDVCCAIGSDSLAFAAAGDAVMGIDIDPMRVEMARLNAAALGLPAQFEVMDARDPLPLEGVDFLFYDPARRDASGKRIHHVEQYQPPLSLVQGWDVPRVAVKLSPGVDLAQLAPYGGGVEFISANGDLKEAALWLGDGLRPGHHATLLTDDEELHWWGGDGVTVPVAEPRGWLVEPDPALLRAGLVGQVAARFGGAQLDETIAYFTTDDAPRSAWLRAWRVLDWMPFNVKTLRAYLRERNVGTVTVKKRGSPLTPETLIPLLKLKGEESRTLVLTRLRGKPIVMVCEDIPAER